MKYGKKKLGLLQLKQKNRIERAIETFIAQQKKKRKRRSIY